MIVCDRPLSSACICQNKKDSPHFAARVYAASDHRHHLSQRTNERSIFGAGGAPKKKIEKENKYSAPRLRGCPAVIALIGGDVAQSQLVEEPPGHGGLFHVEVGAVVQRVGQVLASAEELLVPALRRGIGGRRRRRGGGGAILDSGREDTLPRRCLGGIASQDDGPSPGGHGDEGGGTMREESLPGEDIILEGVCGYSPPLLLGNDCRE
jgi:hypothetical protein